jgi:hypothetical protein
VVPRKIKDIGAVEQRRGQRRCRSVMGVTICDRALSDFHAARRDDALILLV